MQCLEKLEGSLQMIEHHTICQHIKGNFKSNCAAEFILTYSVEVNLSQI